MPVQAPDVVTIIVDLPGVGDFPAEPDVGRVYEVAINGVGYMLADNPEKGIEYERSTVGLEPERLATSDTPFSEAVERYSFSTAATFHKGAGQRFLNRETSTGAAYLKSNGFNPFEAGELSVLNDTERLLAATYASPRLTVVSDLYVQTGDAELKYTSDGSTWTTLSGLTDTTGAVTITGLTSDGQYWYAATGRSIIRGTTSNPAADWSAEDAADVRWAAGRIMAAVVGPGSSTPNVLKSISPTGTVEATHRTQGAGETIVLGGVVSGHFYFASYSGARGQIWAWPLGLDSGGAPFAPFVAWDLPPGLIPTKVAACGDSLWIRVYRAEGGTGEAMIYRGIPSDQGAITPLLVVPELTKAAAVDASVGGFGCGEERVFFSWSNARTGRTGLGAVDLAEGGWAEWKSAAVTGAVFDVVVWHGIEVFTVVGDGVWASDADAFVSSASIDLSVVDGASGLDKVWDKITAVTNPMPASTTVEVFYSLDGGGSYLSLGTLATAGAVRKTWDLAKKSQSLGLRLTVTGSGTTSTVVQFVQAQYHALGLADTVLVLPIDCGDTLTGLNGHPLPDNGPNRGLTRARTLETLTQNRVMVQDIDWQVRGENEIFEVLSARSTVVGIARSKEKRWRKVVVLTLRKVGAQ